MAQLMEYAEYLTKEIGPRPAGTEEEQQAALYITECFQKDTGFSAQMEEFASSSNLEGAAAIPGVVVIVVAVLAMLFPVLSIPAFILAAVAAAVYALEAFGKPIVTRALARGVSQNVVAKYRPAPEEGSTARARSRKVVLVAHYDSGKVTPGIVQRIESLRLPVSIDLICVGAMVLAAFFLLIHVFVNVGGGAIVVNILTILCLIVCLYPVLRAVLTRIAPYNEGANNNATGTAALLEVARRISRGSVSEADLAEGAEAEGISIHGEEAARRAGLVPEGAQIRYEAEQLVPPSELGEYDAEERLLAAKAAIAALTGQPVERRTFGSVASHLVNSRAAEEVPAVGPETTLATPEQMPEAAVVEAAPSQSAAAPAAASPFAPAPASADVDGYSNAPSWFVAAQQNAKKPAGETGPIQRSRYADAIEAAEREAAERERAREEQERLQREAELKAREEAARAALATSVPAPVEEPVEEQAEAEEAAALQVPEVIDVPPVIQVPEMQAPVFVPYEQAMAAEEPAPVVRDGFSESLGETMAFDPHQLGLNEPTPADEPAEAAPVRAASRLAGLPTIGDEPVEPVSSEVAANDNPSRSGMFRKLRADVPSLSGVIRMQEEGEDASQEPAPRPARYDLPDPAKPIAPAYEQPAAAVSEEAPVVAPAAVEPPADAPVADDAPVAAPVADDVPVAAPADPDITVAINYQEELEQAEERPRPSVRSRSRAAEEPPAPKKGGFFSRFRRHKRDELDETPQEWLGVDEDFDARTVGRERGGWESFRDDAYSEASEDGYYEDDYYEDEPYEDDGRAPRNRRWEGGGFSRVRLGRVSTRSGEDSDADLPAVVEEPEIEEEEQQIAEEIEQIYHFRNPLYNTEIWFVALGSEVSAHDGVRAFMADHADELRGSMIIEVESLGAGDLALASEEGRLMPAPTSSRAKRYLRDASAATGIVPGSVSLAGSDSAASILQASGYQTMHLLGVEDGLPALKGSADDVLENVDDLLFDDHVNFLMELLKK